MILQSDPLRDISTKRNTSGLVTALLRNAFPRSVCKDMHKRSPGGCHGSKETKKNKCYQHARS